MDLQAGQRLDDRYVLVARLGKGGQGEVWRVEDSLKPGTVRAVKLMSVVQVGTTQIERVRREAKQLVQLQHPSLVSCYGLFEDVRQEVMGLVMDYVEGESLDALVDDPRLIEKHRLAALGHVAGVLAYVHQRAVVHRDIKLENILLSREFWDEPDDPRHLKMIDFGIAASSGNPQPLTVFGHVIGTPGYMPPEVVDPDYFKAERSQPAGDVFAWGVLAWRLLMKGHPSGLKKATLNQLANVYREAHETRSDWPPGLPPTGWAGVVARALTLDATHRPKNGLALVELLQQQAPEMAAKTVPLTARTPALGQIVNAPEVEPPTVREGAQRPSAVPTIADQAAQPPVVPDPAAAPAAGPEEPTVHAPLHLQPTVLAPRPPPFAPSPPATASPPFAPSPPFPGPPPQDSSPLSSHLPSKRHLALALAAAGGIAVLLFVGLVIVLFVVARGRSLPQADSSSTPSSAKVRSAVVSRAPLPATDCASGVPCEPHCAELLDDEAKYELRFTYVQLKGVAIQKRYPQAEVCTSVANTRANEVCTPVAETQRTRFAREYLTLTHADLAERGLDITVRERPGGTILASTHAARPKHGVIKQSALCRGYVVPGPFTGTESVLHATYYIHPEGSPAAR